MRFAVSLLIVLGISSVIGTVLKQNERYADYIIKFGQFWFEIFERIGLFDVYHSAWFLLTLLFLVCSTSLCVYRNTPMMLREFRSFREGITERSLRAFKHHGIYSLKAGAEETAAKVVGWLQHHQYHYRQSVRPTGDMLIVAKVGHSQRLGYILTHVAIVLICAGGFMDGNIVFKLQELLGYKKIETRNIAPDQVASVSRLPPDNLSFRASMALPEGAWSRLAYIRVRDGYLLQELPFAVRLKQFRIQHYASGQPKSFESDVEIFDSARTKPLAATIKVNHPLQYKGITLYQSSFQDGGSHLFLRQWSLRSNLPVVTRNVHVFDEIDVPGERHLMKLELDNFNVFNVLDMGRNGKKSLRNVGPSMSYKLRDHQGQAQEYVTYMQPVLLDGRSYFLSGWRTRQGDEYRYLRIPADSNNALDDFMRLRSVMFDSGQHTALVERVASQASGQKNGSGLKKNLAKITRMLLVDFTQGGFQYIAQNIEKRVPEKMREQVADVYIKMLTRSAYEALMMAREQQHLPPLPQNDATFHLVQDSLNAISDLFMYPAPYYFELTVYEQRQESGFQVTRSPGKVWVYSGSVILVIGLFVMFFVQERRIFVLIKPSGGEMLLGMSSTRQDYALQRDFVEVDAAFREII